MVLKLTPRVFLSRLTPILLSKEIKRIELEYLTGSLIQCSLVFNLKLNVMKVCLTPVMMQIPEKPIYQIVQKFLTIQLLALILAFSIGRFIRLTK